MMNVNPADELLLQTKLDYGEGALDLMRDFTFSEIMHYGPTSDLLIACLKYCCHAARCDLDPEIQAALGARMGAHPSGPQSVDDDEPM